MLTMPNDIALEDIVESMEVMLRSQARIYIHLARAALARFGRDGERSVRLGLRAYGHWRGREMREAHHALGRPINMKTLISCWDNASTYVDKGTQQAHDSFQDYDAEHDVHYCPAAEAWKAADCHQMGHWYCDEFHQAAARTYHPDGNVTIHENLMKGDDHCHFRWLMPPDAAELELGDPTELGARLASDYEATSEIEGAWKSLKRSNRLLGGHFFTCAVPIIERHGAAGREAVREALVNWGRERGHLLRARHAERDIAVTLANFIRRHDLPVRLIWPLREVEVNDHRVIVEIDDTPQDQAWADAGAFELARLWYEASYPAMAAAYLPRTRSRWTALRANGDATNRLSLELEG